MQLITGADGARPAQFVETNAKNAMCWSELAFHNKAHSQCCGMPAACRQPAKDRFAGGLLVEVVRLWIELRGERYDLVPVYPQATGAIDLAYGVIFKILLCHFPNGLFHER